MNKFKDGDLVKFYEPQYNTIWQIHGKFIECVFCKTPRHIGAKQKFDLLDEEFLVLVTKEQLKKLKLENL